MNHDRIRTASLAIVLAATLAFSAEAGGGQRHLRVGQSFTISLAANPSTGYSWSIDSQASQGLDRLRVLDRGVRYPRPRGDRPMIGAPGTQSWQVTALANGTAQLVLVYRRAWENQAPARRYEVGIDIAP